MDKIIVRILLKAHRGDIRPDISQLAWQICKQTLHSILLLEGANGSVFLMLVVSRQSLPRQFSFEKVKHQETPALQVVSSAQLLPIVTVQRRIPCRSCHIAVKPELDMLPGLLTNVPL
jgi:hypothetical protein